MWVEGHGGWGLHGASKGLSFAPGTGGPGPQAISACPWEPPGRLGEADGRCHAPQALGPLPHRSLQTVAAMLGFHGSCHSEFHER